MEKFIAAAKKCNKKKWKFFIKRNETSFMANSNNVKEGQPPPLFVVLCLVKFLI